MCAYSAALTVIIVDLRCVVSSQFNASFGTVYPADATFGAFLVVDNRSESSPRASLSCASNTRARKRSYRQIILVLGGLCHWSHHDRSRAKYKVEG